MSYEMSTPIGYLKRGDVVLWRNGTNLAAGRVELFAEAKFDNRLPHFVAFVHAFPHVVSAVYTARGATPVIIQVSDLMRAVACQSDGDLRRVLLPSLL